MNSTTQQQGMGRTLREDLRRGDFKRTLRRDYAELKEMFIDDHRKERLGGMGKLRRWLYTAWWLLKSLFFKLTPARRILFVISFFLLISSQTFSVQDNGTTITFNSDLLAGVILLFILMLELKDKLLAQNELEDGRAIQFSLMPERSPSVDGWSCWLFNKSANEVSGDLVDFQQTEPGRYLFSLADVAGKGLKAALVSTKLQATIRALATEGASLSGLASKINKLIHRDTTRNMFASLVTFRLSPDSGEVRLINAGHLPPVVMKGEVLEEMGKGDPAIGIFPETVFAENTVRLNKGELLVVYSDGIPDAKNSMGEFYGTQRLFQLLRQLSHLPPQDIGERVTRAVEHFVGEARVYDDISLIIVRREA
jgi:hypothetical protein